MCKAFFYLGDFGEIALSFGDIPIEIPKCKIQVLPASMETLAATWHDLIFTGIKGSENSIPRAFEGRQLQVSTATLT